MVISGSYGNNKQNISSCTDFFGLDLNNNYTNNSYFYECNNNLIFYIYQNKLIKLLKKNDYKIKKINKDIIILNKMRIDKMKPKSQTATFIYHNKYHVYPIFLTQTLDGKISLLLDRLKFYKKKHEILLNTYTTNEKIYSKTKNYI